MDSACPGGKGCGVTGIFIDDTGVDDTGADGFGGTGGGVVGIAEDTSGLGVGWGAEASGWLSAEGAAASFFGAGALEVAVNAYFIIITSSIMNF